MKPEPAKGLGCQVLGHWTAACSPLIGRLAAAQRLQALEDLLEFVVPGTHAHSLAHAAAWAVARRVPSRRWSLTKKEGLAGRDLDLKITTHATAADYHAQRPGVEQ
jgi:hypothetical protein